MKAKEKIKKYGELWSKIRYLIRSITNNSDDYYKNIYENQIWFRWHLTFNKTIEIPIVTIVIKAVFHENNKYYSQVFLDECLYKLLKYCIMIELTFLNEIMLIKQVHQKCHVCHYWYFLTYSFNAIVHGGGRCKFTPPLSDFF